MLWNASLSKLSLPTSLKSPVVQFPKVVVEGSRNIMPKNCGTIPYNVVSLSSGWFRSEIELIRTRRTS